MDRYNNMSSFYIKIEHIAFFVQFFKLILHHVQKTGKN